jgi:hypothetical protein
MRAEVRAGLLADLRGEPEAKREEGQAYRRNWRQNLGAHALVPNPAYRDTINTDDRHDGSKWRPRPEHLAYVRRFLDLAAAHKITVFWLMPTNAPVVQALFKRDGRERAYARFVRSVLETQPGVIVLDPTAALAGPDASFADVYHLDRRGAVALSGAVATVLERSFGKGLGAQRWIAMSMLTADTRVDVEDLAQSAEAIRTGAARPAITLLDETAARATR